MMIMISSYKIKEVNIMANPLTKNVTHLKNLLDHFECLPEYLQMNIKYNLNECIEAIYRDYNRKVYYNCPLQKDYPNGFGYQKPL